MLQNISSSSWSPKRSYQPWVKKERKTLSKMNIAQSINFPIPSPTAGSQAIKSPHSGNTSTDILYSHPQFFSDFLLWRGGVLWSNKNHFYLQISLEIKFSQTKSWSVLSFHVLILYGVNWWPAFCLQLSTSVKLQEKYSQSLCVNTYSIKQGFMKKGLRSKNENVWEMPSWSWRNKADNFRIKIFILIFMCS